MTGVSVPLPALAPRDRLALTRGAATLALLVLAVRGVPAYRHWREEARLRRELAVERAESGRTSVATLASTGARLAEARRRLAAYDSAYVDGESATAAGAALAELVSETATMAELQLSSVQATADSLPTGTVRRVRAKATVSGDYASLAQFVESLEEGMPLVAVRSLDIVQNGVPAPDRPEQLRAELEVEAVARVHSKGGSR